MARKARRLIVRAQDFEVVHNDAVVVLHIDQDGRVSVEGKQLGKVYHPIPGTPAWAAKAPCGKTAGGASSVQAATSLFYALQTTKLL